MTQQNPSAPAYALINPPEPGDLAVAISVAQKMLAHYGTVDSSSIYAYTVAHGGLAEALRLVLRALDVEPATLCQADEALRRARQTGGAR